MSSDHVSPVEELKPFHIYIRGYARAFYRPTSMCQRVVLYFRGWRPNYYGPCWQKPNQKQRRLSP